MSNLCVTSQRAPRALFPFMPRPAAAGQSARRGAQTDELFAELLNAYRASGGLARLSEVIVMTRGIRGHEAVRMAAWIIERKVVSFEWQADPWLPLFQFKRADMTPWQATQQVVRVLNPVLGPWALAAWFVRPHALLQNRSPADTLHASFPAVMHAARAEPAFAIA